MLKKNTTQTEFKKGSSCPVQDNNLAPITQQFFSYSTDQFSCKFNIHSTYIIVSQLLLCTCFPCQLLWMLMFLCYMMLFYRNELLAPCPTPLAWRTGFNLCLASCLLPFQSDSSCHEPKQRLTSCSGTSKQARD